jgi:hypothetical protein
MKRLAAFVLLAAFASTAYAACPKGTKYECRQGPNGKQVCGCYYY